MIIKQLSVFIENRAGRGSVVAGALAEAGIDILAYTMADMREFGVMRLIVSDVPAAEAALANKGFAVIQTDVSCVACPNETGSLARVMKALSDAGIQVEYMYAFQRGDEAWAVIRSSDLPATDNVLSNK